MAHAPRSFWTARKKYLVKEPTRHWPPLIARARHISPASGRAALEASVDVVV
jgi:hypothetical protein